MRPEVLSSPILRRRKQLGWDYAQLANQRVLRLINHFVGNGKARRRRGAGSIKHMKGSRAANETEVLQKLAGWRKCLRAYPGATLDEIVYLQLRNKPLQRPAEERFAE